MTQTHLCDPLSEPRNSVGVVARLLGHKTTKLTTHYAKLLEKNIIKEVNSAFGKV